MNNNLSRFKQETESELTATKRDKEEAVTKAENLEKKVSELKVNRGGSRHTSVANLREKSGDRSGFLNLSACNAVDLCAAPGDKLNE